METFFHGGSDTLLLLLIGVMAFFLKREIEGNSAKHDRHFSHAGNLELHETERERNALKDERRTLSDAVLRHSDLDDKRFGAIDTKLEHIQDDLKNILKEVVRRP